MSINLGVNEKFTKDQSRSRKNVNTMAPAIAYDKKNNSVRIEFDQPVEWLEIRPDQALGLAMTLIKAASRGFVVKQ